MRQYIEISSFSDAFIKYLPYTGGYMLEHCFVFMMCRWDNEKPGVVENTMRKSDDPLR